MKTLAIIPARGGSKGVPRKNIKLLGNKPLLAYTIEAAYASKLISEIIVSTDDAEIAAISRNLNVEVPYLRPAHLAADNTPTIDVIFDILQWYKNQNIFFDAVCLLQPTVPFRESGFIDNAIQKFVDYGTDSLVSVQEVPHQYNPHWCFQSTENDNLEIATGEKQIISRRQDLPKTYFRDGSVYITKATVVLEKKSLYGDSISYCESNPENYVNIDTISDWHKAELISDSLQNKLK